MALAPHFNAERRAGESPHRLFGQVFFFQSAIDVLTVSLKKPS